MITATTGQPRPVFLSAEWRDLLMLNYKVDPALLLPHLPSGTSLDAFEGTTYISLVAFRFRRTKLLGRIAVPYHSNFLESICGSTFAARLRTRIVEALSS